MKFIILYYKNQINNKAMIANKANTNYFSTDEQAFSFFFSSLYFPEVASIQT